MIYTLCAAEEKKTQLLCELTLFKIDAHVSLLFIANKKVKHFDTCMGFTYYSPVILGIPSVIQKKESERDSRGRKMEQN